MIALLLLFVPESQFIAALAREWDSPAVCLLTCCYRSLVFLNVFFVAANLALVKVRRTQLDALADEGNKRAVTSRRVVENLNAYLSSCQLGITLGGGRVWVWDAGVSRFSRACCNLSSSASALSRAAGHNLDFVRDCIFHHTALHLVLGEQAPKILAIQNLSAHHFCSPPLRVFYAIFSPFIWFLTHLRMDHRTHFSNSAAGRVNLPIRKKSSLDLSESARPRKSVRLGRTSYQCARSARTRRARYHDTAR